MQPRSEEDRQPSNRHDLKIQGLLFHTIPTLKIKPARPVKHNLTRTICGLEGQRRPDKCLLDPCMGWECGPHFPCTFRRSSLRSTQRCETLGQVGGGALW